MKADGGPNCNACAPALFSRPRLATATGAERKSLRAREIARNDRGSVFMLRRRCRAVALGEVRGDRAGRTSHLTSRLPVTPDPRPPGCIQRRIGPGPVTTMVSAWLR